MDNVHWAKTRESDSVSWHIVQTRTRNGAALSRCGRIVTTVPVDNRTEGKTCESCLRLEGPK